MVRSYSIAIHRGERGYTAFVTVGRDNDKPAKTYFHVTPASVKRCQRMQLKLMEQKS